MGQARKAAPVRQIGVVVHGKQVEQSLVEGFFFPASESQNSF
jgi:hypothetical protein